MRERFWCHLSTVKQPGSAIVKPGGRGGEVGSMVYLCLCCICISLQQGEFGLVKPGGGLVVVNLYLYWCCICISLHQGDFGIVKPRGIGRVGAGGVFRAPTFCSQAFYTNGQNQCPNKLDGFKVHKNWMDQEKIKECVWLKRPRQIRSTFLANTKKNVYKQNVRFLWLQKV